VRAGDLHILAVFRDGIGFVTLNSLPLQDSGDLVVSERLGGVFVFDEVCVTRLS